MPYQDGLTQASARLDPLAALRAPVTALLGVSAPAAELLKSLGVTTVLDLATLPLLIQAREIVDAADNRGHGAVAWLDRVPGGYVSGEDAVTLDALVNAELTSLRTVTPELAQRIEAALLVETVGDLGRWLPFTFARQVLNAAVHTGEPDPAQELVPRMGEYPTERCFYSTVLIDHVEAQATEDLRTAGAIDIAPTLNANFGFSAPAVGARLTFAQSWFAHGVTLGNLLHSVALAPGESTRIAVLDWSRRTRSAATEAITESERLAVTTSHNRAVSEVQDAVATEAQSGFSHTESTSTTKQGGGSVGFSAGPISLGGSASIAKTKTSADSFSSSFGARELAASMSQKVMDSTQQAASSVRDRRASLVMEVSEEEHESVSTRILANYNHMHALTIQYYEVVEVYRVTVDLVQVERCLFVPMKLIEMNEATIRRYQPVLAEAALTRRARELLTSEFGTVRVTAVAPRRPWRGGVLDVAVRGVGSRIMARRVGEPATPEPTEPEATPPTPTPPATPPTPPTPPPPPTGGTLPEYDPAEIARAARISALDVVRPGSSDLFLPRDATLSAVAIQLNGALVPVTGVALKMAGGAPQVMLVGQGFEWRTPRPVELQDIAEIVLTTGAQSGSGAGSMTLELELRGALFPVTLPVQLSPSTTAVVCRMSDLEIGPELLQHLQGNQLYYSQAIWRSLDASTIALLLSRYHFENRPVADQVDPVPLMIAGNYIVLRMPAFTERRDAPVNETSAADPLGEARARWRSWLNDRGLLFTRAAGSEQLVPIPTGGVFAEAVLGRSNSAEKLDATRFWNWQDSPIPLAPPEIAAINLASRAQPVDARPGQLGQPILNIMNPSALPDPTGLGASLGALASGGMFRDMSGLAGTQGLAQSVAGQSAGAARSAGELAQAAMATAAQKEVALAQIQAQKAAAALASPNATTGSPKNASEAGAAFNTARELDREAGAGVAGGGGTGSGGGFDGGGSDGGGGFETRDSPTPEFRNAGSHTSAAFDRMVWGPTGVSSATLVRQPGGGGGGSGGSSVSTDELYFYVKSEKDEDYRGITREVEAIRNGSWKPTSVDFDAICERSGKRKPGSRAKIDNFKQFLERLAEPVRRFNFFVYGIMDNANNPTITFDASVNPDFSDGVSRIIPDRTLETHALDADTIGRLIELRNMSSQREFRGLLDAIAAKGQDIPNRELWWYQVNEAAALSLIKPIALLIGMPIFIFEKPIQFIPDYQASPPKIHLRGQVGLGFDRGEAMSTRTKDIHTLDSFGQVVSP